MEREDELLIYRVLLDAGKGITQTELEDKFEAKLKSIVEIEGKSTYKGVTTGQLLEAFNAIRDTLPQDDA